MDTRGVTVLVIALVGGPKNIASCLLSCICDRRNVSLWKEYFKLIIQYFSWMFEEILCACTSEASRVAYLPTQYCDLSIKWK